MSNEKKGAFVNFESVSDRPIIDKRFQREQNHREEKLISSSSSSSSSTKPQASTSTFDAFKRMAAGLDARTLADKMADPNRPTWEQYKKDNEDKLDMVGGETRKMVEYRAELDRERENKLKYGAGLSKQSHAISDSDNDDSDDSDSDSDDASESEEEAKKVSKKKEKRKREKKEKKENKDKKEKKSKKSKVSFIIFDYRS